MPTPRKHAGRAARQRAYRARRRLTGEDELRAKNMPASPAISTMPSLARLPVLAELAVLAEWYRDCRRAAR